MAILNYQKPEKIVLQNGLGGGWISEVVEVEKRQLTLNRLAPAQMHSEPEICVTVAQAIGKGDKFEEVIQHGTEVGISRFIPVISERTMVKFDPKSAEEKRKRWQAIALNAAEQSHRSIPPQVDHPAKFRELVNTVGTADLGILLHPSGQPITDTEIVEELKTGQTVTLFVGPEGGWSDAEIEIARGAGLKIISLGEFVLRTETAALVAAAQIFALRRIMR